MSIRYTFFFPILAALILGLAVSGFVAFRGYAGYLAVQDVLTRSQIVTDRAEYTANHIKNADQLIRETMAMTIILSPDDIARRFKQANAELDTNVEDIATSSLSDAMRDTARQLAAEITKWRKDARIILGLERGTAVPTEELMRRHAKKLSDLVSRISSLSDRDKIQQITAAGGAMKHTLTLAIIGAALFVILAAVGAFILAGKLSYPLRSLAASAEKLASGDTGVQFSEMQRKNEVGAVARAIAGFRDGVLARVELEEQAKTERQRSDERRTRIEALIDGFQGNAIGLLQTVGDKMGELEGTALDLSDMAKTSTEETSSVEHSARTATENAQAMGNTARDVTTLISTITDLMANATRLVATASNEANAANGKVGGLSEAVDQIGDVIGLIQDIAGQTNLLALNATIEAARAGEAGKGFSIVASEVKNLANQTAKATETIAQLIARIQESADEAIGAIKGIDSSVQQVSGVTREISEKVRMQAESTQRIGENAHDMEDSNVHVEDSIASVSKTILATARSSEHMTGMARDAAKAVEELRGAVLDFLKNVGV